MIPRLPRLLILLGLAAPMLVGCADRTPPSRLYIIGDGDAVGAEIFLDGTRVGVMERRIDSGPAAGRSRLDFDVLMTPIDVFSVGVDLRVAKGEQPRTYGVYDQVRARRGAREIAFVHTDGRRLVKRIEVKDEAYIAVSFAQKRIAGGE